MIEIGTRVRHKENGYEGVVIQHYTYHEHQLYKVQPDDLGAKALTFNEELLEIVPTI